MAKAIERDILHPGLRDAPAQVDFDMMTDEEIERLLSREAEGDIFAIPKSIIPDGMSYQWVNIEVIGQENRARIVQAEQGGWRAVPAKRHDGLFMPPGTDGPTLLKGMMLMEIPERVLRIKRKLTAREANDAVEAVQDRLRFTPPGTAPRDVNPKTAPYAKRGERAAQEIQVE